MNKLNAFLALVMSLMATGPATATFVLYVSTEGDDSWSGQFKEPLADRSDGPLGSLEAARLRVRERLADTRQSAEPVIVNVRGGRYGVEAGLFLGKEDAGIEAALVTWQAYPGEAVFLDGGARVSGFTRLDNTTVESAVPREFRDRIYVADLKALGIPYPESLQRRTLYEIDQPGPLELYYNGKLMTLARYPNDGWMTIADIPQLDGTPINEGHHADKRDGKVPTGRHYGGIAYAGERPSGWSDPESVWMHGYWTWDWAESTQRIDKLDTKLNRIQIAEPHHRYGYTSGQRYYYFNVPEELDSPGEWYLDRESGRLFFWPPENTLEGEVVVARLEEPFFHIRGASHIKVSGFELAYSRGPGIRITDSTVIEVGGCRFSCLGGRPVTVEGGERCGVRDSSFTELSTGAVSLDGGDRSSLRRGNHYVVNNHIHDFAKVYRTIHPAIRLHGVGQRAAHNLIHKAPHMGLYFRGNDHLIEFNEIHDIARETGDVGAIYTGRDYTARGTVIRYNYLHDLHGPGLHGVRAVYLDDFTSGIDVFGNVFYRAGRAAFIGGGRDNSIQNNIFIECEPSVQVDGRGLSWAVHHFDETHPRYASTLRDAYAAANVGEPPYSVRYPELIGLYEDEVRTPKYNRVENNLSFGGIFLDLYDGIDLETVRVRNNLVADPLVLRISEASDQTPDFTLYRIGEDATTEVMKGNRLWQPDSVPYRFKDGRLILDPGQLPAGTGFMPIPMDRIGLQERQSRAP